MRWILLAGVALTMLGAGDQWASAQEVLKTGGKSGDYYQYFGPPLVKVLSRAWADVTIETSDGTPASMDYLLDHPLSFALAQGNVYADLIRDPKYQGKFKVLPAKIGNEAVIGIMSEKMYGRSHGSWGLIASHAKQVHFALAPVTSGPGRTFQELMTLDPTGLGQATRVDYLNSMDEAIKALADGQADVSLFVQFPNPQNVRFKAITAAHLHMVPVLSSAMKGLDIPGVGPAFALCTDAEVAADTRINTACSPILAVTGASNDNADLDKVFREVKPEDFTPTESGFASLWKRMKTGTAAGWAATVKAVDDQAAKLSSDL